MTLVLPQCVLLGEKAGECIEDGDHDGIVDKLEAKLVFNLVDLVDILVQQVGELDQVDHIHALYVVN